MEAQYGQANRVWVLDRGMVSEDNLEFLRSSGARYLVGTPRSLLKKFEQHQSWEEVQPGVEVQLCPSPEGTEETFVLCRWDGRRRKMPSSTALKTGRTSRTGQDQRSAEGGAADRTASGKK